jgi:alkylhydroperoxidase family enzyme
MRAADEPDERIFMVSAWREAPYYTDAERAALALTEVATRLADSAGIPDEVWEEAARHYDKQQLAGLVLMIAGINAWNRINATTRQITGRWVEHWISRPEPAATTA